MSGDTKQRISNLEAEIAIARQRITDLANENRHLRECHPNMRDQFAMAALPVIFSSSRWQWPISNYAEEAYLIADAMMEARDDKKD